MPWRRCGSACSEVETRLALGPSVRAVALLATLLVAGCSEGRSGRSDVPLAERAERGVAWLMRHPESVGDDLWLATVARLYRVAVDEAQAGTLAGVIRAAMIRRPLTCNRYDLRMPAYQDWLPLSFRLRDLRRCRYEGLDYSDSAAILEQTLHAENPIWRGSLGSRLLLAFMLEQLEIDVGPSYESVREEIRAACRPTAPAGAFCDVYALTHVVLAESGYFLRYLDPADFEVERSVFRRALHEARDAPIDDVGTDILGEILICYKLMRLPLDGDAGVVQRRLAERQNPDGSWADLPLRPHTTSIVTLALLEYAPDLRQEFGVF